MVFVVRKVGKRSYVVKNKFTGGTRAERTSHAEAQRVADRLNRLQERAGASYARDLVTQETRGE